VLCLFQQVFSLVVIIGASGINDRASWHITGGILQGIHLTTAPRGEKKLDRMSLLGDEQVDVSAIEISCLAGKRATTLLLGV
jgi:hypothetical protein